MGYVDEVMADTPALYCPLGERSGTTVVDNSGNARNGTIVGGVTYDGTCPVGGGLAFNGTTGVIQFGTWTPAGGTASATIVEFWAKSAASPVGIYDSAPSTANVLRNYTAGNVEWHSTSPTVALTGYVLGIWNHVVVRHNFSNPNRGMDVYVNGVSTNSGFTATATSWAWTTLRIGNINDGTTAWFPGSVAHFAVYRGGAGGSASDLANGTYGGNDARILARISAHYRAGIRGSVVGG